ncbi:MAG: epoxyqueuosine reductase QueH [Candidatus Omnitrophica bacterium]|nr:epoxyqueuosine reductase QueH [Candidatus Omnitrophota bacterium]
MRLLLHICCGPCALYPIKQLAEKKFKEVTGYYYNPNIHPPSEYKRRRDVLAEAAKKIGFEVIYAPYKMEEYFRETAFKENPVERCGLCWRLRLSETADFAVKNGFNAFTTTLLISPYQDHAVVKAIAEDIAREKHIDFYYEDFRKGFKESQEEAKKQDLYRQKYCGCVFSELERVKIS